ncbi:MAG TPA: Rossmann-like and DUF2520 domain-containing protein [Actinomycetota bacterium]|nr:Rossmann-like and DUF2520 domain-containing protein [Actinomycetota bacterium]
MTARHGPPEPARVALVGAGSVGTAAALLLRRAGHVVAGVASRTRATATRASALLEVPVFDPPATLVHTADVVLLGVPGAVLTEVTKDLAPALRPGTVVVHFAGAVGLTPLSPALASGVSGCALHPVAACPDVVSALRRLPGSAWGVTCADDLRPWAHDFVRAGLAGVPVDVAEEDRPVWHAAAVTTANGVTALVAAAEAMLDAIGVADPAAVLGPLAAGAVANARESGAGATLTGPAVRGETETIARHLRALEGIDPLLADDYRVAARAIVTGARRAGRLDAAAEDRMSAVLGTR